MKKLYRSRSDRMIGGVCGGIAEYFGIDPVIVRIAFIIAVFVLGISVWVYPILWIVIPEEPVMNGNSNRGSKVEEAEIVE